MGVRSDIGIQDVGSGCRVENVDDQLLLHLLPTEAAIERGRAEVTCKPTSEGELSLLPSDIFEREHRGCVAPIGHGENQVPDLTLADSTQPEARIQDIGFKCLVPDVGIQDVWIQNVGV